MPSKLVGLFITIRKSNTLKEGFKIWFLGMESKKGKEQIVLINNTEARKGNSTIFP